MVDGVGDAETTAAFDDIKLNFKKAPWPKIELDDSMRVDLKKSFNLFDIRGYGYINIDSVKVRPSSQQCSTNYYD